MQIPEAVREPLNELIAALCHRVRKGTRREDAGKQKIQQMRQTLKQFGLSFYHLANDKSIRPCNQNNKNKRLARHSSAISRLVAYHDASLNNIVNLSEHWILNQLKVDNVIRNSCLKVLQKDFVRDHDIQVRDFDQDMNLGLQRALQYLAYGITQRDLINFRKSVCILAYALACPFLHVLECVCSLGIFAIQNNINS